MLTHVLADGYQRFAELEAAGVSEVDPQWAVGIADDPVVLDLTAALPWIKRQPKLVFRDRPIHRCPCRLLCRVP